MPSPDHEHKSDSTSLDAERARLRGAGYTDAEVSQILISRASQQPAAAGQGALSNALSSIVAVVGHARALIPTLRKDVATVFDGGATAPERAGATASLAVRAVVVLVLGYAAWQEWQIHIVYQTQIQRNQAAITAAQSATANTRARPTPLDPHSATDETDLQLLQRVARERCAAGEQQICDMLKQTGAAPDTSDQRVTLPAGPNGQSETLHQRIERIKKEECAAGDQRACTVADQPPQ
jgi:hypothetical protein